MLRYEESREGQFHRYVELGRDNQTCISSMRKWCKNVEVEPISSGLYAEFTGLPIGSHAVSCPFVTGKTESMNVRWIVSDFLTQHCAGCPHHSSNGDDSWGQEVINEHLAKEERAQRQVDETNTRIQELRAELRDQAASLTEQATTEARSILAYLEAVFSEIEEERNHASDLIRQATLLGADALPIEALHLITTLARTSEYSEAMLPVCAILGPTLPDLAEELIETALRNIAIGLHVELSAAVLRSVDEVNPYPLDGHHVRSLILSQDHHPLAAAFNREESNYPHSISVLVRSFDTDRESVTSVVREQLESNIDQQRHSTCGAISLMQEQRPSIALDVLESLVASLNLYDLDETSYGPSTKIVGVLRTALRYSPVVVSQALERAFAKARPAVQGDIIDVYRWLTESKHDANQFHSPELAEVVIDQVLVWVRNDGLPIEVRNEALESLESAFEEFPSKAIDKLETLLGYLAVISIQEEPPSRPPPLEIPGQPMNQIVDQLDRQTDRIQWNTFKRRLAACLSILSRQDAPRILQAIADCLDQPLDEINVEFKTNCVWMLGEVATKYEVRPLAVPYLWRALMDFSSPATRAEAIEAIVKMFGNGVSPPPNMVEMVLVYLVDDYVVVHQAALRAVMQRRYWFDKSRTFDLLVRLEAQLNAYKQKTYQVDDICDAIMRIGQTDPRWKAVAIRLIETVFPTGEEIVDRHIAHRMIRFGAPSEAVAVSIGRMVAIYLGQHEHHRVNNFGPSEREQMIVWLRGLPIDTYQHVADDLLICAMQVAERDLYEGCFLAGVLAHFMAFEHERDVLESVLNAIPDEPRRVEQRNLVRRLWEAAAANASLHDHALE